MLLPWPVSNTLQVSIRQNFRLNGEDHYTIFDLPISVTNRIEERGDRPSCDLLENPLLTPEEIDVEGANDVPVLFAPGSATTIEPSFSTGDGKGDGLGPAKPGAGTLGGLGNGAGSLSWKSAVSWLSVVGIVVVGVL